ncbi:hypothetical protein IAR55_006577 [Kwoniella newhampshirensis]|uniref:AMP-dependent synthetase/ligase domain-containing protein n=1 Tax=Kwoniella newhampshirensis TaxID=1651941 RepID=A0AAW0YRI2_9TREE
MPEFEIDNLTLLLLALLAALAIYHRFFSTPQPLVHPLLLGKQSEVSAVRKKGETGVYRSWATGQGTPLTVRPANTIKTVQDVISQPKALTPVTQRYILDVPLTDEALAEVLRLLPIGLELLFPRSSSPTSPSPIMTLLPPSPNSALPLLLLSLSVKPNAPLVILPSPRVLTTGLTAKGHPVPGIVVVHASLFEDVAEQVWEDCRDKVGILIVGDPEKGEQNSVEITRGKGMEVHWWEEVWDVAESEKSEQVTVRAGMAALLSIFPADKRLSAALHDTVASAVRLDTPLGMTIALASVWTGAGFRLIGNTEPVWDSEEIDHAAELEILADPEKNLPQPTVLFISPKHHHALLDRLQYTYEAHPWAPLAARHKSSSIRAGHIDRDSLWDRVLSSGMRENVLGGVAGQRLRGVILVGDAPPPTALGASHLLLSLPLTRLHPSIYSTGPIFVTHFYDLQSPGVSHILKEVDLWRSADKVHSGPPATNVEVRLKGEGVDAAHDAEGSWIEGRIWVRGPSILERVAGKGEEQDGWVDIGEHAKVQTNGTFIVDGLAA